MAAKPTLLSVDRPNLFGVMEIVRNSTTGETSWAIPRRSGKVRLYPLTKMLPRGCPFSRELSEENQERLEAAREAVYGYDEWS